MITRLCIVLPICIATLSCTAHAPESRAQYEQLKSAILAAPDPAAEARAIDNLGHWFKTSPYGYTLSAQSQPGLNGLDISKLEPGQPVELSLHASSDYEPRPGGFTFVPRDKKNLLLLEGGKRPPHDP
jgi:hypothetical protein